jgi:hypothetical protein
MYEHLSIQINNLRAMTFRLTRPRSLIRSGSVTNGSSGPAPFKLLSRLRGYGDETTVWEVQGEAISSGVLRIAVGETLANFVVKSPLVKPLDQDFAYEVPYSWEYRFQESGRNTSTDVDLGAAVPGPAIVREVEVGDPEVECGTEHRALRVERRRITEVLPEIDRDDQVAPAAKSAQPLPRRLVDAVA